MIKSMTAYAEKTATLESITATVTIRSYNSKNLDISLYCPDSCQAFEEEIKKIISGLHSRGRIEIRVLIEDNTPDTDLFEVDENRAVSYYNTLKKLQERLGISSPITIDQVLAGRNIIIPIQKQAVSDDLWTVVSQAVKEAGIDLDSMRRKEGENLQKDLEERIAFIEESLKQVEVLAAQIPLHYKKRLMERIACLTQDTDNIDPVRLAQEAAILSDKSDVSEEIVRLYSHIKQFRQILMSEESQGRKLNFLIQEFNREFNTIGSKSGNTELSHLMVDLKSVLEQIREQVQNIE